MMTANLFVIDNVKQLQTDGSFRIVLPFFPRASSGVGVLNSAIFNSFHNRVKFGKILEGLRPDSRGDILHIECQVTYVHYVNLYLILTVPNMFWKNVLI